MNSTADTPFEPPPPALAAGRVRAGEIDDERVPVCPEPVRAEPVRAEPVWALQHSR